MDESSGPAGRRPRADAARNREHLLAVAKEVFAADGAGASLNEIARRAGVGIGTLYRHFPTRDALLAALYRRDLQALADAGAELARTREPLEALRAWLRVFASYLAGKKMLVPLLEASGDSPTLFAEARQAIQGAVTRLMDDAAASGALRPGIDPADPLYALSGYVGLRDGPDREEAVNRLIDILIEGMRVQTR